jgi:hypothetical protein
VIGALPHERTGTRSGRRNGYRAHVLPSAAGDLELRIPRLRAGSFFPSLPERRRRVDQSLFAVIMEAPARHLHPQGSMTWSRAGRRQRHLQVRRQPDLRGPRHRSARSATEVLPGRGSGMCSWTRPTARPGSITGRTPRPWSWPPGWPPTGTGRC